MCCTTKLVFNFTLNFVIHVVYLKKIKVSKGLVVMKFNIPSNALNLPCQLDLIYIYGLNWEAIRNFIKAI